MFEGALTFSSSRHFSFSNDGPGKLYSAATPGSQFIETKWDFHFIDNGVSDLSSCTSCQDEKEGLLPRIHTNHLLWEFPPRREKYCVATLLVSWQDTPNWVWSWLLEVSHLQQGHTKNTPTSNLPRRPHYRWNGWCWNLLCRDGQVEEDWVQEKSWY